MAVVNKKGNKTALIVVWILLICALAWVMAK